MLDLGSGAERFRGTLFDAALDAAAHKPWVGNQYGKGGLSPSFSTQICHIQRAAAILGLEPGIGNNQRHATAQVLTLPSISLAAGAVGLENDSGYQNAGRTIQSVLNELPEITSLFERITETGFQAGLWPEPLFLDPPGKGLRLSMFRHFRTRAPPIST